MKNEVTKEDLFKVFNELTKEHPNINEVRNELWCVSDKDGNQIFMNYEQFEQYKQHLKNAANK